MTETPPTDQGPLFDEPKPMTDFSSPRKKEGGGRWWGLGLVALLFISFLVSFIVGNRMLMPFQETAPQADDGKALDGQDARLPEVPEAALDAQTALATGEEPAVPTPPPAVEEPAPPSPIAAQPEVTKPAAAPRPVAETKPVAKPRATALYRVQAGAFSSEDDAVRQGNRLKDKGYTTFVREGDDNLWRVQVGAFENRKGAELLVSDLKEKGFEAVIVSE